MNGANDIVAARVAWVIADADTRVGDLLAELDALGFAALRVTLPALAALPCSPSVALIAGSGSPAASFARRVCGMLREDPRLLDVPIVLVMPAERIPLADPVLHAHEMIVRPLRRGELLSRIDRATAASPVRAVPDLSLRAGGLVLDPGSRTVSIDGRPIEFSAREFELLAYLVRHPVRVHSRSQLLQGVWRCEAGIGSRAVDVLVRRVRAKLGAELSGCIRTVRRVGYAFTLPS